MKCVELARLLTALLLIFGLLLSIPNESAATPTSGDVASSRPAAPSALKRMSHGRFSDFIVYTTNGTPMSVVLLLSGDQGWNAGLAGLAEQLVKQGAMVAGIDTRKFKTEMATDGGQCVFPDGDLENLSHFIQAYFRLPNYLPPVLMGYASGATLAYSVLAQAPHDTFAGALTLGFCPTLVMRKPPCKGSGFEFTPLRRKYHLTVLPSSTVGDPWINLQAQNDRSCKADDVRTFVTRVPGAKTVTVPKTDPDQVIAPAANVQLTAAFDELAAQNPVKPAPLPPAALGDLPVVYVPALAGTPTADSFALIMSGDGGWAGLDEDVAAALTARGIPVIGLDSLRYYWTPRTPEGIAADTDRIIRYYLAHLQKSRVLLIGYSQGADVLPFAVNRLPAPTRARVALTAIMGMSEHALFEFHLSSWISDDNSGPATLPEVNRITGMPVLCIYGADEDDSLCPKLDPTRVSIVKVKGGHHFDGDYAGLAKLILAAAAKP